MYSKRKKPESVTVQEEWPVKVAALPHSQLPLNLNILEEDSKGRRRPKYHYWAVQKVFPTRDWTNTQGNLGKNFVNPLKACKIWVECGCFPLRRSCCCCCLGEVRVGCCFPRWVWCIIFVLVELPRAPKTPTENVSCEVQGWHTELGPVLHPNPAAPLNSEREQFEIR